MRLDEQKVQIMREKKVDTKVRVSQSVQARKLKKKRFVLSFYTNTMTSRRVKRQIFKNAKQILF